MEKFFLALSSKRILKFRSKVADCREGQLNINITDDNCVIVRICQQCAVVILYFTADARDTVVET